MKHFRRFDDLTWKYMKAYKKRTIFTILGVMLAVFLFFGSGTIYVSLRHAKNQADIQSYGDVDCYGENIAPEEYRALRKSESIRDMVVGYPEYERCMLENVDVLNAWEQECQVLYLNSYKKDILKFRLLEGAYPQNDREIMIYKDTAEYMNYKVGDEVPIFHTEYWDGTKKISDDSILAYRYLWAKEKEDGADYSLDDVITRKTAAVSYTVVGIYDRRETFGEILRAPYTYPIYSRLNPEAGYSHLTVYIRLKNHVTMEQLVAETGVYSLIAGAKTATEGDFAHTDLEYILFVMAFAILFWIGVIIIRNSFVTSVAERTRDYGILRCMGTSQHRLRMILMKEGLIEVIVGYGLGIGLTVLAIEVGRYWPPIKRLLYDMDIYDVFGIKFNIWITLATLLFASGAVFFSLIEPARQIGAMAPVSAVQGHANIRKEKFRKRDGRFFRKIFGIEGEYAYKNVLRNKGKFIAAVVGITVSVVGIIISFSMVEIMKYVLDADDLKDTYSGTASFFSTEGLSNEKIMQLTEELETLDSITDAYPVFGILTEVYGASGVETVSKETTDFNFLHGIEEEELQALEPLLLEGSLDMEALRKGGVLICRNTRSRIIVEGKPEEIKRLDPSLQDVHAGDAVLIPQTPLSVSRRQTDTDWQREVQEKLAETNYAVCPVVGVLDYYSGPDGCSTEVIMLREAYQKLCGEGNANGTGLREIRVKYSHAYNNVEIMNFLRSHRDCKLEDDGTQQTILLMEGYQKLIILLAMVIAGIGAVNIFSTLSSNITQRRQELNILNAVGMSRRQIWKMLGLEGGLAAIIGSMIGIITGLGIGFLLTLFAQEVKDGDFYFGVEYQVPWMGIGISLLLTLLITGVSLLIAYKDMKLWEE